MSNPAARARLYQIAFGCLAQPIEAQLNAQGFTIEDARKREHLQQDADAISQLRVRGLITETESDRARKRLILAIKPHVRKLTDTHD